MEQKQTTSESHAGCFFCTTAIPFVRSIIDERIERLSRAEPKGTHVVVE